ncbi:type II toxin-antitoxin system PemK/MazF family toxin [Tessaracoccus sp. G1721]
MARNPFLDSALRVVRDVAVRALDRATQTPKRRRARTPQGPQPSAPTFTAGADYPGDYTGRPDIVYTPHPDGRPDPGEVVWTWVPYEDDHTQGKDRPVLLVGHDGPWLLGLQVTSQDHDRDAAQEASVGRYWTDIGTGEWDNQRRPSEVRVNRLIRIDPDTVRRVGAVLDERIFDAVAREVLRHY